MVGCRLWCQVWVAISLFTSTRLCPCMPLDFLSSCRSVLHPRACERLSAVNPHELRVRCAQQRARQPHRGPFDARDILSAR